MGGFAVENEYQDQADKLIIEKNVFTYEGIILLGKAGRLPSISLEDVEEGSNADLIAKIIVLSQAGWFAI